MNMEIGNTMSHEELIFKYDMRERIIKRFVLCSKCGLK